MIAIFYRARVMSSSTSSSERRPPAGLAVLAMVILVMLALEVVTRTALIPASRDLNRFTHYPEQARVLGAVTGRRVAFVGDSFTGDGIDPALFGRIVTDVQSACSSPITPR